MFKKIELVCPCKDDVPIIADKMKAADGLIIISPIYEMGISGQLKAFLDRIIYLFHIPVLYDKHAFLIFSIDVGGIKPVSMHMKYLMNGLGINMVYSFGVSGSAISKNDKYRYSNEC